MTFPLFLELLESKQSFDVMKPFIDKICKLIFMEEGVKSGKHYGVVNKKSTIVSKQGEHLFLTFDNSNAQGEFELNSLASLEIEKGSATCDELEKMYKEHEVKSKAKLKYITKGGKTVLRGINFGADVDERVIRMVQDVMVMLSHEFERSK